jgi:hypothetical protein
MHLMVELLEQHDRRRFEVTLYSHARDDGSAMRRRVEAACEHFAEVRALGDDALAQRIRDDGIDILVDLKGYTRDNRFEVFARRAAPVQASWLGYPGTTGAPFIDHLIGDRLITPLEHAAHYRKKLAQLPACTSRTTAAARGPMRCRAALVRWPTMRWCSPASTSPTRSRRRCSMSGARCWASCPTRCCGCSIPVRRSALRSRPKRRSAASLPIASSGRRAWRCRNIWRGCATPICLSTPGRATRTPPRATRCGPVCRW